MSVSLREGEPGLALGPVLYYWPRDTLLGFYAGLPHASLATIYLGEVICGRRHEMRLPDGVSLAGELAQTGAEVVLSTQALIESDADLRVMRRIAENGEFTVEANEMGAVRLLSGKARFVAGPHLNVYNPDTLAWLGELGAFRWVMPLEMGREALAQMQAGRPAGMQAEVFAYGRLPLAFSARCFTARHFNLSKDDCQFRCLDDPDGRLLSTREGKPFLALNGIQTQSAQVCDLLAALPEMRALGVDRIRLSPQSMRMNEVIEAFGRALDGSAEQPGIRSLPSEVRPGDPVDGYWYGKAGIAHVGV